MTNGPVPSGVLPVLKAPGLTSHDVVARVRRLTGLRRIGHTGTLDPGAAGVLVLLVGRATRLADLLQAEDKEYVAEMCLGLATDTQDSFGQPVGRYPHCRVGHEQLVIALQRFVGAGEQVPPMTSAIRQRGRRLYELAREGIEVERQARPVFIADLHIVRVEPGLVGSEQNAGSEEIYGYGTRVVFRVVCSKGTYVRTLCHDIGEALGCGAHMTFLLRTRVGDIDLAMTRTLDELEQEAKAGQLKMLPPDAALGHVPAAALTAEWARRVQHGQPVPDAHVSVQPRAAPSSERPRPGSDMVRLYDSRGQMLALAARDGRRPGWWVPRIVFPDE